MSEAIKGLLAHSDFKLFEKKFGQFNENLAELLTTGVDFNIRLEIRGTRGKLIHCRLATDDQENLSESKPKL